MKNTKLKILSVGMDLSSNGGIASVVKTLYYAENKKFDYTLLKTCYYKDKGLFSELVIFINSLTKYFFMLLSGTYDIIHIHSSMKTSFYRKSMFLMIGQMFSPKKIIHIHSSAFDDFFINSKGLKKLYIKFILSKADKIFVLCNDWKRKIKSTYGLESDVVHNPIKIPKAKAFRRKPEVITIVFIGFLIPSKGISDLLEVVKHFKNNSHVKFIIAGKGDMESEIIKTLQNFNISNSTFIGWADEKMKNELLDQADLLFLPSYKEGMPIVILEAMSNSIPIISTKIAGIPELVYNNENGFLTTPGNIADYIKMITFFINCSDTVYNRFREKSRAVSEGFSDEMIVTQIEKIYTSIS